MRLRGEYTIERLSLEPHSELRSYIGIQLSHLHNHHVVGELSICPRHLQHGFVSHEVLTVLGSTIIDYAVTSHLPDGAIYSKQLTCTGQFFRPSHIGKIICEAEPINLRKDSFVWEATLYDDSNGEAYGNKLATFYATHLIAWPKDQDLVEHPIITR